MLVIVAFFVVVMLYIVLGPNESINRLNGTQENITQINLIN